MKNRLYILIATFLLACPLGVQGQIITTVAGGDSVGLGDGGPAVDCELKFPYATAIDGIGNLYIADAGNNRIRKVNTAGIITTIAGTGIAGYSGDDSAATNAKLNSPGWIVVDGAGNVYFSDDYSSIRKINYVTGIITTIAGNGTVGYAGDYGPATAAILNSVQGIALDNIGNIFLSDELNNRIRKISSDGIITTIAGIGMAGYSGNGGQATAAEIDRPYGVAIDASGNIFFTEWGNNCVRKINNLGIITTIAGGNPTLGFSGDGGPATAADFHIPIGIAVDSRDNVYIADSYNNRIREVNTGGIISTIAGTGTAGFSGDGEPAILAELYSPVGVTLDKSDNIYITEYVNERIRFIKNILSVNPANSRETNISIYPNPSNGSFTINISSNTDETASIGISNELGQNVKEISVNTNHPTEINIEAPPGVYFLTAITVAGKRSSTIEIY